MFDACSGWQLPRTPTFPSGFSCITCFPYRWGYMLTHKLCLIRKCTEIPEYFTSESKQTTWFLWIAFIDWLIERTAWPSISVQVLSVISTVLHRALALTFHFCSPGSLCPFIFFFKEDNRFRLSFLHGRYCLNALLLQRNALQRLVGGYFLFWDLSQSLSLLMCSHQRHQR